MHGQSHCGNANVKKMRILCVRRKAHNNIRAQVKKYAFYAWEEMRIIYVGKIRILCMGKHKVGMHTLTHAHFMGGKKCA